MNSSINNEEEKQKHTPKPTHQNQLSLDGVQNSRGRFSHKKSNGQNAVPPRSFSPIVFVKKYLNVLK